MISQKIRDLKEIYQNFPDNIGKDLIEPCLSECTLYRRGTAFFSSSALNSWASAIERVLDNKAKIEILCSPKVSDRTLLQALQRNQTEQQRRETIRRLSNSVMLLAIGLKISADNSPTSAEEGGQDNSYKYRGKILSYLIASGRLEVRFAIHREADFSSQPLDDINTRQLYHVKNGYFEFGPDTFLAFDGSFNESGGGHHANFDRAQVFKSWEPADNRRASQVKGFIDIDWNRENKYLEVFDLSETALQLIRQYSSDANFRGRGPRPAEPPVAPPLGPEDSMGVRERPLWRHQVEAVTKFLESPRGILQMATGTGKTVTALEIISRLFASDEIDSVIISTYGTDLLNQWKDNLDRWAGKGPKKSGKSFRIYRHYEKYSEQFNFFANVTDAILLVSRESGRLSSTLRSSRIDASRTLIIHDEVHGFGAPGLIDELSGLHEKFCFRLGLSATPERMFDEKGTSFIQSEIGPIIYEYDTASAIKDGILCEFEYVPLYFSYTDTDRQRLRSVYARKAQADKEGRPWNKEFLYTELAKVRKKAETKPARLMSFLKDARNRALLVSSIIFVADTEQGDEVCRVISNFTKRYRTYYSGTDDEYLAELSRGSLESLVACERLNEGVDINSLRNIFLVSSDRARLSTIQRLGRCLRTDPKNISKRATVVDFVLQDEGAENADTERAEWLLDLSKSRKGGDGEHS